MYVRQTYFKIPRPQLLTTIDKKIRKKKTFDSKQQQKPSTSFYLFSILPLIAKPKFTFEN